MKSGAVRRHKELVITKPDLTVEQVLADLCARDARDATRDVAPMKAADDALLLDTTELSIDDAVQRAISAIKARVKYAQFFKG